MEGPILNAFPLNGFWCQGQGLVATGQSVRFGDSTQLLKRPLDPAKANGKSVQGGTPSCVYTRVTTRYCRKNQEWDALLTSLKLGGLTLNHIQVWTWHADGDIISQIYDVWAWVYHVGMCDWLTALPRCWCNAKQNSNTGKEGVFAGHSKCTLGLTKTYTHSCRYIHRIIFTWWLYVRVYSAYIDFHFLHKHLPQWPSPEGRTCINTPICCTQSYTLKVLSHMQWQNFIQCIFKVCGMFDNLLQIKT